MLVILHLSAVVVCVPSDRFGLANQICSSELPPPEAGLSAALPPAGQRQDLSPRSRNETERMFYFIFSLLR